MTWRVRRASLRDRRELQELCEAAVGPEDYVLPSLDRTILREVLHVAFAGDRVVGMMALTPCIDDSGWLRMARTHPRHRRQGVARALIESFVGLAHQSEMPALRLWSEATNADGNATATALGFREVGRFARLVGPAARGAPKARPTRFDEGLWRGIADSPLIARGGGYVPHEWYFVPASRPVVFALAAKGYFRGWDGHLLTVATEPEGAREDALEFALWSGDARILFPEACRQAAAQGRGHAEAFVPLNRALLAEARRAGFDKGSWGREAVLYELAVSSGRVPARRRPTFAELRTRRGHADAGRLHEDRWNA